MYTKEDFLRENPIPWEEKILERGREEGVEAGREALLLNIQRVIALRFEIELDHFAEALQDLNFAGMQHLSELAFEVDTLAEFETAVVQAHEQFLVIGEGS